ncbi:golvesin C-terminal-like domain-containing protein [Lentzea flava]|uniref:Golvesin/Xly CBD-like domain-containing protein n=1 Tax=Lentzea flava TaxID=103732 RepID=A0ABQ2UBT3_9PSEU|nr:hypothetical protein [Lentzea flava]MCP2197510.1 Ricin-type beta-trefoil lectin domain [Lentzea flava]GGU20215.1 hypothetical protein GCM10010178_10360 [Lentzea flava]
MLATVVQAEAKPAPVAPPANPDAAAPLRPKPPVEPPVVPAEKRQELLGQGWQQSGDRLWTTYGDGTGFHVLVAEAKTGYSWRTVATLGTKALETDKWIGNACVTGDGTKAVVVYAPRTFTNKDQLFARGGLTAVVDLVSGEVKKLPVKTTLAYFNPGCGTGDTVALTQGGEEDRGKTRLLTVDAKSAQLSKPTDLDGQLTSAVPFQEGFAVASGGGVLKVGRDGQKRRLALTKGTPSFLRPDAENGVVFVAPEDTTKVSIQRATAGVGAKTTTLATGKAGELGVAPGSAGKVFITGKAAEVKTLPQFVRKLDVDARAEVSTNGETAIIEQLPTGSAVQGDPQAWHLKAKSLRTGKEVGFTVDAVAALKPREVDPGYTCAIPRNDTNIQVYQPKPKQVEWAADLAVKGYLTVPRSPGYRNLNNGSYTPQGLFPQHPMVNTGGRGKVPAQILLGIMGQESNLWQAARHALPGELGNPLIGNYYGLPIYDGNPDNDWDVDFSDADCGYGVTQMTDGMRKTDTSLTYQQKFAIATDYAANVAAGLQKIQEKWNQVQNAGMKVHDNDFSNIENWFLAVWAYNSGFNAQGQKDPTAWGVGWSNNPANPKYDPNRTSFGENPRDFATPQKWPYPEKVMGFAAFPPSGAEDENTEVALFLNATWNGDPNVTPGSPGSPEFNRRNVKPDRWTFCNASNNCVRDGQYTPNKPDNPSTPEDESTIGEPTGPCAHQDAAGYYDLRCWWHSSVSWKSDNCSSTCGFPFIRYDYPQYANESSVSDGVSYPPTCDLANLPIQGSSLYIDHSAPNLRQRPCNQPPSSGSMTFRTDGRPAAMVDLHQIGSGLGSHMWQTTVKGDNPTDRKAEITAEWKLNATLRGKADVWAFIPAHGKNKATEAQYRVETKDGVVKTGVVDQSKFANKWALIGSYVFNNAPKVTLSSVTPNGGPGNNQIMVFDSITFSSPTPSPGEVRIGPIVNNATGKCLAPRDPERASPVGQQPCTGTFTDHWFLSKDGQTIPAPEDIKPRDWTTYKVVHRGTGLCLGAHEGWYTPGNYLEIRPCDASSFVWHYTQDLMKFPTDNGYLYGGPGMAIRPKDDSHDDAAQMILQKIADSNNPPPSPYLAWDY